MFSLGDVLSKLMYLKHIIDGGLGAEPPQPQEALGSGGQAPSRWVIIF